MHIQQEGACSLVKLEPLPPSHPQAAAQAGGKISDAASRQAVQMLVSLHLLVWCNSSMCKSDFCSLHKVQGRLAAAAHAHTWLT